MLVEMEELFRVKDRVSTEIVNTHLIQLLTHKKTTKCCYIIVH
jgi:hypothetical protein